ncbi:MAG TPA: energy transducer TonB [Terriglobales bacterium]|jgi:TonB family protein
MVEIDPRTVPEPEFNLLLPKDSETSVFKSLFRNLDDFFFPKKLPPLVLTSKPIPVRDIWGFYDNKKNGVLGSTIAHIVILTLIVVGTIIARRLVKNIIKPDAIISYMPISETPTLKPSKTQVGGGGGGGDRDKFQAPKGKLPKQDLQPITPPMMVVRNPAPKLAVEPAVAVPPQVKIAINNMPNLGNPMAAIPSGPPSNGVGSSGGIGSGSGGGVGSGEGPGFGPGHGGGTGGGVFRVGGGVSAPKPILTPDPEYSEEARKAKFQGTCVLSVIVGPDGRTSNIHIARSLGLGLDEKAIEAVKGWTFQPAMKDGRPVAVAISVQVEFHLY